VDRADLGGALGRAFAVGPTAALLVPEEALVTLVMTSREVVFNAVPAQVDDRLPNEGYSVRAALIDSLDQVSEPFADMLDLPYSESTARRAELVEAAGHVRDWLDAGCLTLPPSALIRELVDATLGIRTA